MKMEFNCTNNEQYNAQVSNLFSISFCLTCFEVSISPSSEAGVQLPLKMG
jgi:hypothetical protein